MRRYTKSTYTWLPIAALLSLAGCKECPTCPTCPECPTEEQSPRRSPTAADGRMSRSWTEHGDMTGNFVKHFRRAGGGAIAGAEQEVPWSELKGLMDKVDDTVHRDRGLVFHYGMSNGAFKIGLSPVALVAKQGSSTEFTYDHKVPVRSITGNRISSTATPYATWFSTYTKAQPPTTGTYFNNTPTLEVRRTDADPATFVRVEYGNDVEHEVMPFEREIERLHRENSPPNTTEYDEYVVISCASLYDEQLSTYRHCLVLHMRYRLRSQPTLFVDALSDRVSRDDDPAPFFERAADLGNLCPPASNCGVYVLQQAFL